ncbi:MAG: hypothetical protein ACTSPI_01410 [Candidatus Heimdallarchaeaceae archaeon]
MGTITGPEFKSNKKTLELYLAHPVKSRKKIRKWELDFEKRTGIILINPFYDVQERAVDVDLPKEERKKLIRIHYRNIVQKDIEQIVKSQGIIAVIDRNRAVGTLQEIVYANMLKKSVYTWASKEFESHPWVLYHSDKIFTELKDLEKYLILISREKRSYP